MQQGVPSAIPYCHGLMPFINTAVALKNCQLKGEIMADHDENFRDSSGPIWFIINLAALAWITMPVPIALTTIVQW